MPHRLVLASRVLLTAGLAVALLGTGTVRHGDGASRGVLVGLTVLACVALLLSATERGRPALPVPPTVSTAALVVLAACGVALCWLLPDSSGPAVPLVLARLSAQARLPAWGRYTALVVATASLAVYTVVSDGPWWAYVGWAVAVGVLHQSGLRVQSRRQQLEDAELLLAQEQALREEQVRSAAAVERTRIARELHDVLAHTLSGLTVTLQATAALLEAEGASPAAREQVGRARALAVDGLAEARTAVASLASGDEGRTRLDLRAVVERQVREHRITTQAEIALRTTGALDRVPAPVVGAASGILREALTNAVRHAPGRPVRVTLAQGDALVLTVEVDEGSAAPAAADGGMGLAGMRQRAIEVGGDLAAGPSDHGWRVEARLPVGEEAEERG
ncbi:sensor histidine kinase [Microlunatus flavus]|uniref:Histidine kinase n=1 Tax=Microlunatus flavus TaxID=1036181 RepID=A0A1H8ZSD2_9ACTN|nr:histidine kinase [Microlunatus flavus]SEP67255.1 Histidine kinase [Microlunatus flavus]